MSQKSAPASRAPEWADARRGIRHVFVRDLVLHARVGVHAPERRAAQRVRINVDLAVFETVTDTGDALGNVVCYEDIVGGIRDIVENGHVNLVETLADRIAAMGLDDRRVRSVRVRVEKLDVFEDATSVGVEIERTQPDA